MQKQLLEQQSQVARRVRVISHSALILYCFSITHTIVASGFVFMAVYIYIYIHTWSDKVYHIFIRWMDGWMDGWRPRCTAMGQASSPAFAAVVIGAPVGVQAQGAAEKGIQQNRSSTHPHHDLCRLSEEILSSQGRGMFSKTLVVPRKGALSQSHTGTPPPGRRNHPTPTYYSSHSPSHGSKPLTLDSKWCWPTPVVTASLQYRRQGMARAGKPSCRAAGTSRSRIYFDLGFTALGLRG